MEYRECTCVHTAGCSLVHIYTVQAYRITYPTLCTPTLPLVYLIQETLTALGLQTLSKAPSISRSLLSPMQISLSDDSLLFEVFDENRLVSVVKYSDVWICVFIGLWA